MDQETAKARRDDAYQAMQSLKKAIREVETRILNAMTVLYVAVPLLALAAFFAAVYFKATGLVMVLVVLIALVALGVAARVQPLRREKGALEDDLDDETIRYRYFYLKSQIYSTLDRAPEGYPPEVQHIRKRRQSRRLESLMDDAKQSHDNGEISQEAYEALIRSVLFEGEE